MANGRLAESELAQIAGGGLLQRDAARAWNAFAAHVLRETGYHVEVSDSYRPLGAPGDLKRGRWSQWAAWERYRQGGNLAAHPGTSNHGLGLAVDVPARTQDMIRRYGEPFGWAKRWSDAPSENWHFKWKAGTYKAIAAAVPKPLKQGQVGPTVVTLKKLLFDNGLRDFSGPRARPSSNRFDPYFGANTAAAVRQFQRLHKLTADGLVGDSTWRALRA